MKINPIPSKPFSSREEVIWAAGLFEGEGWISIQGKSPSMGIQMTDRDVLDKFQRAIGAGNIYYRKPRIYAYEKVHTRKPQWAWRLNGFQRVQAVLAYLWPWLGMRRRTRAREVLLIAKTGQVKKGMVKGAKYGKPVEHGDVRKYWRGCSCGPCKEANNKYSKRNREALKQDNAALILSYSGGGSDNLR